MRYIKIHVANTIAVPKVNVVIIRITFVLSNTTERNERLYCSDYLDTGERQFICVNLNKSNLILILNNIQIYAKL